MDTHIAPNVETPDHEPLSVRLPEEEPGPHHASGGRTRLPDDDDGGRHDPASEAEHPVETASPAGDAPHAEAPSVVSDERPAGSQPPRRRRTGLMVGAASAALLVAVGGAYLLSPSGNAVRTGTTRPQAVAAPLAPSAKLASVDVPPGPGSVIQEKFTPSPKDKQLEEVRRLHPRAGQIAAPQAKPAAEPPPAVVPHEPGSMAPAVVAALAAPAVVAPAADQPAKPAANAPPPPVAPLADATSAVLASIADAASRLSNVAAPEPGRPEVEPAVAGRPLAAASTKPATEQVREVSLASVSDPLGRARSVTAAPMAAPEQIEVLDLVTQVAALVHTLQAQSDSLRSDLVKARADDDARLADFQRRLALAEARKEVASASAPVQAAAPASPVALASAAGPAVKPSAPVAVTQAAAALPSSAVAAKRYHVQAASPGLALLAEIDRGGGDGAQIQVAVGDDVPGYGRVKSVGQRGTAWVVATEGGSIQ